MPYLTLTENLQLSPGLVASYDIQPGNGVGLFWDKHVGQCLQLCFSVQCRQACISWQLSVQLNVSRYPCELVAIANSGVASYGALGHVSPLDFQQFHF